MLSPIFWLTLRETYETECDKCILSPYNYLEAGLLLPEHYQDALKAKRTLSLSRGRSTEREDEREN